MGRGGAAAPEAVAERLGVAGDAGVGLSSGACAIRHPQ